MPPNPTTHLLIILAVNANKSEQSLQGIGIIFKKGCCSSMLIKLNSRWVKTKWVSYSSLSTERQISHLEIIIYHKN